MADLRRYAQAALVGLFLLVVAFQFAVVIACCVLLIVELEWPLYVSIPTVSFGATVLLAAGLFTTGCECER